MRRQLTICAQLNSTINRKVARVQTPKTEYLVQFLTVLATGCLGSTMPSETGGIAAAGTCLGALTAAAGSATTGEGVAPAEATTS